MEPTQLLKRQHREVEALFRKIERAKGPEECWVLLEEIQQKLELHMRIAEYAGSRILRQMIERNHVLILNWLFDVAGRRTPLPPAFHSELAEVLVTGAPEQADQAMRLHVRYGLREIATQITAIEAPEWRERRRRTHEPAGAAPRG